MNALKIIHMFLGQLVASIFWQTISDGIRYRAASVGAAVLGQIVVSNDEWQLSDEGGRRVCHEQCFSQTTMLTVP